MKKSDISNLKLLGKGPIDGARRGHFLKCSSCGDLVEKAGFNSCSCGNISMDGDMLRFIIENVPESEVEQWIENE